jgi:hypothetical protein
MALRNATEKHLLGTPRTAGRGGGEAGGSVGPIGQLHI